VKPYLISLAAGLLIGVIYSLLNVRSPAPPMIALVGLLGILIGEQLLPIARRTMVGNLSPIQLQASLSHRSRSVPARPPRHLEDDSRGAASKFEVGISRNC
jgi:XapX domain-containing protein